MVTKISNLRGCHTGTIEYYSMNTVTKNQEETDHTGTLNHMELGTRGDTVVRRNNKENIQVLKSDWYYIYI